MYYGMLRLEIDATYFSLNTLQPVHLSIPPLLDPVPRLLNEKFHKFEDGGGCVPEKCWLRNLEQLPLNDIFARIASFSSYTGFSKCWIPLF